MRKRQRDSLPRSAMRLLCTLLGIILGLMLAVSCIFGYCMNHIGTNIQSSDTSINYTNNLMPHGAIFFRVINKKC